MNNIRIPKPLKRGDTIGICCPAGAVEIGEDTDAVIFLKAQGFEILKGATVGTQYYKFSGTDEERIDDMQRMIDNPDVRVILCGRGGYGAVRVIDSLDFSALDMNPKWIIGYSDITNFHSHIHTNYGIATMHGHMLKGFQKGYSIPQIEHHWMEVLLGGQPQYEWQSEMKYRCEVTAPMVGGNLAILSDLVGTNSDIDTNDKILVIEDVGEYLYNIDRMMMQMKKAGKLQNLKALIVGTFNDLQHNEIPFGESIYDIMLRVTEEYDYPVVFDFPFGHQAFNYPIVLGAVYHLAQNDLGCTLQIANNNC